MLETQQKQIKVGYDHAVESNERQGFLFLTTIQDMSLYLLFRLLF